MRISLKENSKTIIIFYIEKASIAQELLLICMLYIWGTGWNDAFKDCEFQSLQSTGINLILNVTYKYECRDGIGTKIE